MSTTPLKILFAGSGEFGLPTLKALVAAGHEIVHVYSQPDRPAGRGRTLTPTPIAQHALASDLPLTRTENLNAEPLPPADLLVVIAFGQKVSEAVTTHCRLGSVNLHASLLPKYRGAAPINWAILKGETSTGNSIIRLAQRMDAGAVLAQSQLPISDADTAGDLHDRLAADGAPLMLRTLEQLATGTATEMPQDESLATLAPKLSRNTAKLHLDRPSAEVARQINGLSPWPGCRVSLCESHGMEIAKVTLVRARPAPGKGFKPGDIDIDGHVGTGNYGAVEILQVQPEGGRVMSIADFRNGRPWTFGLHIEAI